MTAVLHIIYFVTGEYEQRLPVHFRVLFFNYQDHTSDICLNAPPRNGLLYT